MCVWETRHSDSVYRRGLRFTGNSDGSRVLAYIKLNDGAAGLMIEVRAVHEHIRWATGLLLGKGKVLRIYT